MYYTEDRGDGSFDYDCSGAEEPLYTDVSEGCSWDPVYLTCEKASPGWVDKVADCGTSAQWIEDCAATYDPICYEYCAILGDPPGCLESICGAPCAPAYATITQACR